MIEKFVFTTTPVEYQIRPYCINFKRMINYTHRYNFMTKKNLKVHPIQPIEVWFGEAMWLQLLELDDNTHLIDNFIEREAFRVAHTELTYRQINYLDKAGLLGIGREDKDKGWRVFKFRDIVYLNIINEMKRFGIRNDLLRSIHTLFYELPVKMNEVILLCLVGVEMTLIFGYDGTGFVFNPSFLTLYEKNGMFRDGRKAAEMHLVINDVVNDALKSMGKPEREITHSIAKLASDSIVNAKPTEVEMKILEAIRDSNYQEIRLKKKDGKPSILYASSEAKSNITEKQLLAEITKLNFSDVEIKKRDGKVVHYRQEKTIKL